MAEEAQEAVEEVQEETTEAQEEVQETKAEEPADWRLEIKNEEARKFAESSTDIDHLATRALEMRQKLSNAVVRPGENASEEEIAAYNKALGVPDSVEGYEIQAPEHLEEEVYKSEEVQGRINNFAETMLAKGAPKEVVDAAFDWYWKAEAAALEAQSEADKKYAEESDAALEAKWGKEFKVNSEFSNRGAEYLFGDAFEDARHIEMKDGRYLLDNPVMKEALAKIGRETSDSNLGPTTMTEETRESTQKEFDELKREQHAAYFRGDQREANRLQARVAALAEKLGGNEPLVGDGGRQI